MRESPFKNSLKRALAYRKYAAQSYNQRVDEANRRFRGKKTLPLFLLVLKIIAYAGNRIRIYNKSSRDKDHEQLEKDALNANNKIATFTVVIAVVAFASACVSWRTLEAIEGQLAEMKGSGTQTDKIIEADNNLASAAKDQAAAAKMAADTAKENIELSQRAWVGPLNAKVDPIVVGQPINATVQFQNMGKQPAQTQNILSMQKFSEADYLNRNSGYKFITTSQELCRKNDLLTSYTVTFPTQGNTLYNAYVTSAEFGFVADGDIVAGNEVIVVSGCIIYQSFKKTRHSYFAYFYKKGFTDSTEHLNFYPFAGFAD